MKLRKIMAGVVATALAASTLAVAASAACLTKVEGTESTLRHVASPALQQGQ